MSSAARGARLLAFDVGGSHTRAGYARLGAGGVGPDPDAPAPPARALRSPQALIAFVREVAAGGGGEAPAGVAVCVAGPVERGRGARLTNWPAPNRLLLTDLLACGLPPGRVALHNDMEAACHGLGALLAAEGYGSPALTPLRGAAPAAEAAAGNVVVVAPGTGLGAAALVRAAGEGPAGAPRAVPCEAQHTPIPVFDAEQAGVMEWLRRHRGRARPSWEDVVSGRALPELHAALGGEAWEAERVAAAALDGEPRAARALGLLYRCAGRFCQLAALAFDARGAVVLGGESTRRNRDFILRSGLVDAFLDNSVQGELLARVPLLLLERDVNLDGALHLAALQAARAAAAPGAA